MTGRPTTHKQTLLPFAAASRAVQEAEQSRFPDCADSTLLPKLSENWTRFDIGRGIVAEHLAANLPSKIKAQYLPKLQDGPGMKVELLCKLTTDEPRRVLFDLSNVKEGFIDLFIPSLTTIVHQQSDPAVLTRFHDALKRFCQFVRAYDEIRWTPECIPVELKERLEDYNMSPNTVREMADDALKYLQWWNANKPLM